MTEDQAPDNKSTVPDIFLSLFRGMGKVMNLVGVVGFCVLAIVIGIYYFTDAQQKKEVIDVWILFKGSNNSFIIIVLILLIIIISQQIHYKYSLAQRDERIKQLADKKSTYQRNKLGNNLSSSKKTRKP